MTLNTGELRRYGAAAEFLDSRLAEGRVAFPLSDLVKETGLSIIAARNQLMRLSGKVVRISSRRQFFLIVGPEHRAIGAPPPEWWLDDYFAWLGRPYYLALQSAANTYGSSPQAPQVTQVMTDIPRRQIRVGRIRVLFFVKRRIEVTPTQPLENAYAPMRVSTPAATAFDLIRYADRIGGIARAVETLVPLLPRIRVPDLKGVLQAENEVSTAQRLGYVMEAAGKPGLADIVEAWLPHQLSWVPLSLPNARTTAGAAINRWRVLDSIRECAL
jgi:predicted transcriptional regulator of viral defense system